jgi:hypothetical protein
MHVIYNYFCWQFSNWHTTYIFVKCDIQYFLGLIFWQNYSWAIVGNNKVVARLFASIKYKYSEFTHLDTGTASSQFTAFLKNIIRTPLLIWFDRKIPTNTHQNIDLEEIEMFYIIKFVKISKTLQSAESMYIAVKPTAIQQTVNLTNRLHFPVVCITYDVILCIYNWTDNGKM